MKSKEEKARIEGMSYAFRYAKDNGIDALEKELKFRGAYNVPLGINSKALQEFTTNVKNMTLDTVLILACMTLRDEFGFGKQRIQRFIDRFDFKAECIGEDYATWQDQIDVLKEECGIELAIRQNDKNVRI